MENTLVREPARIGGLLIAVGVLLLSVCNQVIDSLLNAVLYIMRGEIPEALWLVFVLFMSILCIACLVLFFWRNKLFVWLFPFLCCICIFFGLHFIPVFYAASIFGNNGSIQYSALLTSGLALILYVIFSRRARNTFSRSFIHSMPDPSVSWLLMLTALRITAMLNTAFSGLSSACFAVNSVIIFSVLFYLFAASASIYAIILFFQQRQLFIHMFIALTFLFALHDLYQTLRVYPHPGADQIFFLTLFILFCISFCFYLLLSKRVSNTFIHNSPKSRRSL